MTCKLYLVPEDVINSWRSEQREKAIDKPVNTVQAQMDAKMSSILKKDIPDYDKEKLYAQELEKLRTLRNQNAMPPPPIPGDVNISLASIPKMYQRKAEGLLDYLRSTKNVSWDEKGQLRISGRPIERSHILDLIHDAVRYRKMSKRPEGWRELSTYLEQSNVPRELVGNPAWMKGSKGVESSEDTVTPDSEFESYSDDSEFHDAADVPKASVKKKRFSIPRASKTKGKQKIKEWVSLEEEV